MPGHPAYREKLERLAKSKQGKFRSKAIIGSHTDKDADADVDKDNKGDNKGAPSTTPTVTPHPEDAHAFRKEGHQRRCPPHSGRRGQDPRKCTACIKFKVPCYVKGKTGTEPLVPVKHQSCESCKSRKIHCSFYPGHNTFVGQFLTTPLGSYGEALKLEEGEDVPAKGKAGEGLFPEDVEELLVQLFERQGRIMKRLDGLSASMTVINAWIATFAETNLAVENRMKSIEDGIQEVKAKWTMAKE
ncbi:hypothetical protein JR316_0010961 [Psilocybe cubensis]|uniref:Uncharacterized protein n=1 Tax=Psilocybe cubensis TaxID=181762 RepID=A0ACB8GNK0_PSICU|nr:hypothetical protein JR316_0010961 [Psilocybe cubensis]KAH9477045.1 hypothetical protein JR316_0010961 [Psilocybe cubensis]